MLICGAFVILELLDQLLGLPKGAVYFVIRHFAVARSLFGLPTAWMSVLGRSKGEVGWELIGKVSVIGGPPQVTVNLKSGLGWYGTVWDAMAMGGVNNTFAQMQNAGSQLASCLRPSQAVTACHSLSLPVGGCCGLS